MLVYLIGDKATLEQLDRLAPAFEKPTTTKTVTEETIRIECRCKGKQEPKITWKKEKTEIKDTPNKYKISKTKETEETYLYILEIFVRIIYLSNELLIFHACRVESFDK